MINNHLVRLWLLGALLLPACASAPESTPPGSSPPATRLNIFAAASLTEAFTEIGQEYENSHPGTQVDFNFGGSQNLARQIDLGAITDVFASANQQEMDLAIRSGRVQASAVRQFAQNRLVVVYPSDNPGGLVSLIELAKPGLRIVLTAVEVPAGRYSLEFLEKAGQSPDFPTGYTAGVLENVVSYEDNVKIVLTKVLLGEADAAIVYTSDVTGEKAARVSQMEIPADINVIATYPIAPLRDSSNPAGAKSFIDFVLSARGQSILAKHGFDPIE